MKTNGRGAFGERSLTIMEMAARPGGVSNSELQDALRLDCRNIGGRLQDLREHGHIHSSHRGGRSGMRWFSTAEAAQAFGGEVITNPTREQARQQRDNAVARKLVERAERATAPVVRIKGIEHGSAAIVPEHVKFTRCPAPPAHGPAALVYVAPNTRVDGGFAAMGPGRYL